MRSRQKPRVEIVALRHQRRFNVRVIAKRVIPCLDVHDGHVTRGVQFGVAEKGGLRNVGDPVELALRYNEQGADEMVFFDITATAHGRGTMVEVIERAADQCFMPLTVGGGIKSVEDMFTMLRAGADKISINSSALARPELIREGAEKFGSQCIVVSIDAKKIAPDKWGVFSHGGRKDTGLDALEWAKRAVSLGAGEIVLNSIDADGTKAGFDLVITRRISEAVGVPVVASGGAGTFGTHGRRAARWQGRRCAGREHFPFRHLHRRRREAVFGEEKYSGAVVAADVRRIRAAKKRRHKANELDMVVPLVSRACSIVARALALTTR